MPEWEPQADIAAVDTSVLGLDEAGRGSLIGPLVAGGFCTPSQQIPALGLLGVRDSKRLSPAERARIFRELPRMGRCFTRILLPPLVDQWVDQGRLNDLEAQTFGRIVRQAAPDQAFVDACDPVALRFGTRVQRWSRTTTPVIARHHADRDLLVVGAASIIAKVTRDRWIQRLGRRLTTDVGSGYPCDGRTLAHVRDVWQSSGSLPNYVRHSWSTTERLKPRPPAVALETFAP
ncbi:MAG: ribonuclease HII [Thermoplasmata archaeon]